MRTTDALSEPVAAALRGVDEALARGAAGANDPVERELQEIALALRADAPAPDAEFAESLDRRVAARFGRAQRRRWRPSPPPRRALVAGAAALLVVVVAAGAVSGLLGRDRTTDPKPDHMASAESSLPAPPPVPKRPSVATTPGGPAASNAGGARRVERAAQLTLAAPADRLDEVGNGIAQVTDRHRGVVLDSSVSTGHDSGRGGSFTLRVPSSELSATLRDLSRLGQVRARSESGHDVTGSFVSLTDRLTVAGVERRGLLRRLGHATSTAEADRLRSRLDSLSVEIRDLKGQLADVRRRTDYTRVSVTLVEQRQGAGAVGRAGDALRGSLRALVGSLAVVLRVLAAVIPFALLGGLAWAATGALRRRRREAVLS